MTDTAITERQQHWLDHPKTAEASGTTLVEYAENNGLKVIDLYQWKTSLTKRALWQKTGSGFVPVSSSAMRSGCSLVLPNGIRLEFQGVLSPELIRSAVTCARQRLLHPRAYRSEYTMQSQR